MISACRCWANPAGEQLVQVLDLAVQVQQLLGEPGDQRRVTVSPGTARSCSTATAVAVACRYPKLGSRPLTCHGTTSDSPP